MTTPFMSSQTSGSSTTCGVEFLGSRVFHDDNAATAPGKVCELCGAVIKAGQEARRRVSGEWIHEACPIR